MRATIADLSAVAKALWRAQVRLDLLLVYARLWASGLQDPSAEWEVELDGALLWNILSAKALILAELSSASGWPARAQKLARAKDYERVRFYFSSEGEG